MHIYLYVYIYMYIYTVIRAYVYIYIYKTMGQPSFLAWLSHSLWMQECGCLFVHTHSRSRAWFNTSVNQQLTPNSVHQQWTFKANSHAWSTSSGHWHGSLHIVSQLHSLHYGPSPYGPFGSPVYAIWKWICAHPGRNLTGHTSFATGNNSWGNSGNARD